MDLFLVSRGKLQQVFFKAVDVCIHDQGAAISSLNVHEFVVIDNFALFQGPQLFPQIVHQPMFVGADQPVDAAVKSIALA